MYAPDGSIAFMNHFSAKPVLGPPGLEEWVDEGDPLGERPKYKINVSLTCSNCAFLFKKKPDLLITCGDDFQHQSVT